MDPKRRLSLPDMIGQYEMAKNPISTTTEETQEAARVRLTLDLSRKLNLEVERLAQENGTSKADVLRFAVELLTAATAAKSAGMHVGAWSNQDNGNRWEREFIGL